MRTKQFPENVVDLESFSLAFRPLTQSTEIIQYTRSPYTKETITKINSEIRSGLGDFDSGDTSLIASLTALYLLVPGVLELRSYKDQSNTKFWTAFHTISSVYIDFAAENPYLEETQKQADSYRKENIPDLSNPVFKSVFDLLVKIQQTAKRYEVDEIITLENQGQAGFLQDKKNLDYLYNLGVFGTFTKNT